MRNAEINIYNVELLKFKDKNTGELKEMTKIYYLIDKSDTDISIGKSSYECVRPGNFMNILGNYTKSLQKVKANIEERPTEKGVDFVLMSVNDKVLK